MQVGEKPIHILLVEDNPGDARLIAQLLADADGRHFEISAAARLSSGLERLCTASFDLVLLDLSLPDSEGLLTLRQLQAAQPTVPVIVLTGLNDGKLALQAVREGAQDYLVKGQIDTQLITRAIDYARERHSVMLKMRDLSHTDELTGLYNRRGLMAIAGEQIKQARRAGKGLSVTYVDLDGMKRINDRFGHEAGDRALLATATILRSAFRDSDIIARTGGDEFVALAIDINTDAVEVLRLRLLASLDRHNRETGEQLRLSFSLGFAHYDPGKTASISIEALIAMADEAMYAEKKSRVAARA